jgi:hypothetical protein
MQTVFTINLIFTAHLVESLRLEIHPVNYRKLASVLLPVGLSLLASEQSKRFEGTC